MPGIATIEALEVSRDLSGGVRIKLGSGAFVLSPEQAIKYAEAVLRAAGCDVKFDDPFMAPKIIEGLLG